jgi:heptosyltransferase-2
MGAIGVENDGLNLGLCVTQEEQARLDAVLRGQGQSVAELFRDPPIVLAPGAGFGDSKCWPTESYGALADRLAERGPRVILVGGPGEHSRIEAVRDSMKSNPIVLDDVLDLGGLKALIRTARLLIANDSGTRHIAAAFEIPSVVFFGPTSVSKTADNLEAIEVLETEHDCRPCYRRSCPIDHRCLRSISVSAAADAASRALDRPSGQTLNQSVRGAIG